MHPDQSTLTASIAGAAIIAVAAAMLFFALTRAGLRARRALRYRSTFAHSILQAPGYRLRRRLERERDRLRAASGTLLLMPLVFLAVLLAWPGELDANLSEYRWSAMLAVSSAITLYLCVECIRLVLRRSRTRSELAARIAVSHALERVMRRDFAVFHDVDLGKTVVDEVAAGRSGVFALSVIVHPGRRRDRGERRVAEFDGRHVTFPDGTRIDVAAYARRRSGALARHLSSALGEEVNVCPVAVLPGWNISCAAQPPLPVVNERNIDMATQWTGPEYCLLDEQAEAIHDTLSQRCRDRRYRT